MVAEPPPRMITRASERPVGVLGDHALDGHLERPGCIGPWTITGQVVSMRNDQYDDLADAIDRLRAVGWSVGVTAFFDVEDGGQVWVVTGTNGENRIRAEGATCAKAWRRVLDQAAVVEMCRVGLDR